ncbi:MAG: RNA methyltransferase [Clostridia bacterium]|nr:RNA methyltransferase [Clostridia bacterium]
MAEGKRIVDEAFRYAPERVKLVVVTESFALKEPEFVEKATDVCESIFAVSESAFDEISDTDTPQGVLAVIEMPDDRLKNLADAKNIVVLDGVSEPGNMGTVIRTAEALGFDCVYIMKGSADVFGHKTVRATMGSVFRMKFRTDCSADDIVNLQSLGFSVISTTPCGDTVLEEMDVPEKTAVVIGNEAHGVCDEILEVSDLKVKISMDGLAESLNAAVAAGIAMHWIKNASKK